MSSPLSRGPQGSHPHQLNMHAKVYASTFSNDATTPPMSGCTWHTVSDGDWPNYRPLSISQHLPQQQTVSPLQQQIHQVMSQNGSAPVDLAAVSHVTDVLINTVSGINFLKRSLGDHVVASLISLVLKESPSQAPTLPTTPHHPPGWTEQPPTPAAGAHWPFGGAPQNSPLLTSSQATDLLPVGLLE